MRQDPNGDGGLLLHVEHLKEAQCIGQPVPAARLQKIPLVCILLYISVAIFHTTFHVPDK